MDHTHNIRKILAIKKALEVIAQEYMEKQPVKVINLDTGRKYDLVPIETSDNNREWLLQGESNFINSFNRPERDN